MTRAESAADAVCRAFAAGSRLDLAGDDVPAALLVHLLVGEHPQHAGRIPALRLSAAMVRGRLTLPGANVGALVELSGCTFDEPIDLYAADLAGWRLTECVLPGLQAANLRVRSELGLERCTVTGPVELPDARVEGPLRMAGTSLHTATGPALTGIRMVISGVLDARKTRVRGELRLWGARVDGTIDLRGAELACPGGDALEAGGVQVGGNLHCDRGSGVRLHAAGHDALFADRLRVGGTLFLRGVVIAGSVRLHQAHIGSTLDCTGARLDAPRRRPDGSIKPSLDARATTIGKDFYASRGFTASGGVRLSLAEVSKSVNFDEARLGGAGAQVAALRLRRLTCQELRLRFAAPPQGDVLLTGVVAGSVYDSAELWAADGEVDVEDFRVAAAVHCGDGRNPDPHPPLTGCNARSASRAATRGPNAATSNSSTATHT